MDRLEGSSATVAALINSNSASPTTTAELKNCIYTFSDNADSDNDDLTYKSKVNSHSKSSPLDLQQQPDDSCIIKDSNSHDFSGGSRFGATTSDNQTKTATSDEDDKDDSMAASPESQLKSIPSDVIATTAAAAVTVLASTEKNTGIVQPVRVKRIQNGTLPTSGKPMAYAIDKKSTKNRGRPKRKALVAMYQSQISDNQIGIKLKLKKSLFEMAPSVSSGDNGNSKKSSKSGKKRSKRTRRFSSESEAEDSDYKKRRRKERVNNNTVRQKQQRDHNSTASATPESSPSDTLRCAEQSPWGMKIPEPVLYDIFKEVTRQEGCLPTLVRLSEVCSLWRRVSLTPSLWAHLDLATWTKDNCREEINLKWLIENRLSECEEVNFANWKVTNIQCVLDILHETCPRLVGITLTGWKGFASEHLTFLVENFKSLERLDLSSMDMHPGKSAVGLQSFCASIQTMNERLTHLYLAHNRLAGVPQIITALSSHCPNLVLLDLSNVTTVAISHAVLHIEKLQQGCQKLKILRVTNSHIMLSSATLQEQMDSPGFPELEELSFAAPATDSRLINDEYLQRILKTSTKLHLLDIRGCVRLTHDSLIRLPTWDLKHLFLSGCSITRDVGSGLELIASKWAHSLIECDLAWANVQTPLDNAIRALAEKGSESPLAHLNLCGSSVSLEAVKEILINCPHLNSINLSSCRGLPRGVKRLLQGTNEIEELRENLGVKLKYPNNKTEQSPQSTVPTPQNVNHLLVW